MTQTDSSLHDYGRDIFYAAFNAGQPIVPVFQKAVDQSLAGEPEPLAGMLSAALSFTDQFCKQGHTFTDAGALLNDPHAAIIAFKTQMAQRDYEGVSRTLAIIAAGIEAARTKLPAGTWIGKAIETPAPIPAAPIPAAPLEVRVISLPVRETTTKVTRDDEGNITRAAQVERDLVAA